MIYTEAVRAAMARQVRDEKELAGKTIERAHLDDSWFNGHGHILVFTDGSWACIQIQGRLDFMPDLGTLCWAELLTADQVRAETAACALAIDKEAVRQERETARTLLRKYPELRGDLE